YTAGAGWDTPVLLETGDAGNALLAHVVVDAQGNGMAVWYQSDGTNFNIWANRYAAGGGWGSAILIGPEVPGRWFYAASDPQIALDANGNALVLWEEDDLVSVGVLTSAIWVNRYRPGVGWDVAAPLVATGVGYPQMAMDANGNALAVWAQ